MKNWLPQILITSVILLMTFSAWNESSVYKEYGRLGSGMIYLKNGEYSSFRVNPPLVSLVGAIPSSLAGAAYATRADLGFSSFGRDEYRAGDLFIEKNKNHRNLLRISRLGCIALVFIGLWGTFRFARTFSGCSGGYVFLGICLFSPYILGFGPLVVPDVSSALFGAISVYFFWRWLRFSDYGTAFMAGLTLGLAELCKFTFLIFYPLFVVIWLLDRIFAKNMKTDLGNPIKVEPKVFLHRQFLHLIFIFATSLLVINMGYFFEGTGKQLRSFQFQTTLFTGYKTLQEVPCEGGNRFRVGGNPMETALGYLPMPLPMNFIQGIDTQRFDFERGMASYLRGQWARHGWWYYYLYALLVKTPLGTVALFLLAIFCTLFLKGYNRNWRDEIVILLPGIVLLIFVSSQSGFSIHSRYVIPALPFFFVWISKVGRAFTPEMKVSSPKSSRLVRCLTVICLAWSIGSSLWVYPHSIAYFNEVAAILPTPEVDLYLLPQEDSSFSHKIDRFLDAGPLNGPRHLLNSNLDWGQDLFELERWCTKHPEVTEIKISSWISYPLNLTSIPSTSLPLLSFPSDESPSSEETVSQTLQPGWYAISVNDLYGEEKEFRVFMKYRPATIIGYTIYIYHIPLD